MTTPSGVECSLQEINCKDYIVLLKFLNSENYEGFFKCLDEIILETVPNFLEFNILDKSYIYITFYYYNIKTIIEFKSNEFSTNKIEIAQILNNIEEVYKKEKLKYKFNKWDCLIHYPTMLVINKDKINVEYCSCICTLNGIELTNNNKKELLEYAQYEDLLNLESFLKNNYKETLSISRGSRVNDKFEDNVLSPFIFYIIINIYKDLLTNMYNMIYVLVHYGRLSYTDITQMTPLELLIFYNTFIDDKEKQNQSKGINTNDPNINDALLGGL